MFIISLALSVHLAIYTTPVSVSTYALPGLCI